MSHGCYKYNICSLLNVWKKDGRLIGDGDWVAVGKAMACDKAIKLLLFTVPPFVVLHSRIVLPNSAWVREMLQVIQATLTFPPAPAVSSCYPFTPLDVLLTLSSPLTAVLPSNKCIDVLLHHLWGSLGTRLRFSASLHQPPSPNGEEPGVPASIPVSPDPIMLPFACGLNVNMLR
jgi:hypothetical protein